MHAFSVHTSPLLHHTLHNTDKVSYTNAFIVVYFFHVLQYNKSHKDLESAMLSFLEKAPWGFASWIKRFEIFSKI